MRAKAYILSWIFFLCCAVAQGQYYNINFKKYTVNNGMPSDDVECIFQDSRGYIWIGTRFGLSVFDGHQFRNFHFDPNDPNSLGGSRVLQIAEDSHGELWMAIENYGLSRLDRKTFRFENFRIPIKKDIEERFINTLFVENDRSIWIGTQKGVSTFDPATKTYQMERILNPSPDGNEIISIKKDSSGVIWAATYTGDVLYKDRRIGAFKPIPRSEKTGLTYQLYEQDKGSFLVATDKGLFSVVDKIDPAKSSLKKFTFFKDVNHITAMTRDQSGNLWVAGTEKGVQIYFPQNGFIQSLNSSWFSALDPGVSYWKAMLRDKDGGIWLGGEQGLFYYNSKYNQFKTYLAISRYGDQQSLGNVIGISTLGEQIISVSVKGVSVFDRSKNSFISIAIAPELKGRNITYNSINDLSNGRWWISTTAGVLELAKRGNTYVLDKPTLLANHPVLAHQQVYSIGSNGKGDFWFCTPAHGLINYNTVTNRFKTINSFGTGKLKQELNHLDYVSTSTDDDVIVGHHRGFAIKYSGTDVFRQIQELVDTSFDFSNLSVYDIVSSNGFWWIATEGHGLIRFDASKRELKVYGTSNGLVSNSITSVLALDEHRMAIGTSKGLAILDIPSSTFTTYLRKDGLPSEQFVIAAHHRAASGEIFLATTSGIVSFAKDELKHSLIKASIKLSALIKDNQAVPDSMVSLLNENPRIVLHPNESLTLVFSSLNFSNDNDFILRYRFNPDEPWKISQSPLQLSLVNIDAGSYELVVQLMNKAGGVMSDRLSYNLEVIPPFWKTRLFRILLLVTSLGLLWFFLRLYFQRRLTEQKLELEKQKLLEGERVRIAMDLHDDIGGNLTAMNLMTAILRDIDIDSKGKMIVNKIGEASDRMIQDMNEIVWALNISNDKLPTLMSYVRQYLSTVLATAGIEFDIREPETYPDVFISGRSRRNIFMIMKELVNNAIKYAGTKNVLVEVSVDKRLKIVFSDNGIGLQQDMATLAKGGGNGINNLKKRAAELGATVDFINEKGLTVVFDMPLKSFDIK